MSNALARTEPANAANLRRIEFPAPDKAMIQATLAVKITDPKMFALFISTCEHYGLDPRKKQIYGYQEGGRLVVIVGIDGWLKIASETGDYLGHEVEMCLDDGVWRDVLPKGHLPYACRVTLWSRNHPTHLPPFRKIGYFSEWNMPANPNWKSRPAHMLELRTLAHALRQKYPDAYSGAPTDVEIGDSDVIESTSRIVEEGPSAIAAPPDPEPVLEAQVTAPEPVSAQVEEPTPKAPGDTVSDRTRAFNAYTKLGGSTTDSGMLLTHLGMAGVCNTDKVQNVTPREWGEFAAALLAHNCLPGGPHWPLDGEMVEETGNGGLGL